MSQQSTRIGDVSAMYMLMLASGHTAWFISSSMLDRHSCKSEPTKFQNAVLQAGTAPERLHITAFFTCSLGFAVQVSSDCEMSIWELLKKNSPQILWIDSVLAEVWFGSRQVASNPFQPSLECTFLKQALQTVFALKVSLGIFFLCALSSPLWKQLFVLGTKILQRSCEKTWPLLVGCASLRQGVVSVV